MISANVNLLTSQPLLDVVGPPDSVGETLVFHINLLLFSVLPNLFNGSIRFVEEETVRNNSATGKNKNKNPLNFN